MMMLMIPTASAEDTDPEDAIGVKLDYQVDLPEKCAQYAYRLNDGFIMSRIELTTGDSFTIMPDGMCNVMVLGWYTPPQSYIVQQLDASGVSFQEEMISDGLVNRTIPLGPDCVAVSVALLGDGAIGEVKAYAAWAISRR